jgi:predicted transcriptional regulator
MRSIGINLEDREFLDLSNIPLDELYDLLVKSVGWMENISSVLSLTKKLMLDEELEVNSVQAAAMSRSTSTKVTEARASAKADPAYLAAHTRYNTLVAYVEYLERLLVNLDRYHYVIKSKLESLRVVERKYNAEANK